MSQVGRISGPLLQENLIRNDIDLSFETDLIYLDVTDGKVGIKTNSPTNELQINNVARTTNLIVDTEANFPILNFTNSTIQPFGGTNNIVLDARYTIKSSNAKTGDLFIDDNFIKTTQSNSPIEFFPNGTGNVNIFNKLFVDGNINLDGTNFNVDGNIQLGDANTDSLVFNADIDSDIIPDVDVTYRLGTSSKRWQTFNSAFINSEDIDSVTANIGTVSLGTDQGKIWYVSTTGDNGNVGEHQQGPFRTIDYAVTRAQAGDTIYVQPGEYEETCPIVVPQGVTIRGSDLRNTIVKPPTSDNYVDIFKLNGETAVSDITIKDFYYDSVNDVGYAFRYAANAAVITRSPYIQNVSVITKGSVTSASDPRGFAEGDAGKGALVDGAVVLSNSVDASMLFHSVTFITPGVDALTMTNGVKVEWLNSFTYFANRGLYAVDGATGHLSTDGSTVLYGAELRSIGSACVYGNYGAVADGADTLMYLVQHNMGYIGVGKFVDNDPSRAIQVNEIVELNSGKIYYQTVNHFGDFRVGDNFFINQETGESSIVIDSSEVQGFGRLRVTDVNTGNVTIIDGEQISTGNLTFSGNNILSVDGPINIDSTGVINLQDDTNVSGNVDITGNFTFDGQLNLLGNQTTDTLAFNVNISQDLNPNTDLTFTLGSSTKVWNNLYTTEAQIDGIHIEDNFITTDVSNADLELRANGTGEVDIPSNNVQVNNNLTVDGTSNLQDTSVTGLTTQVGNFPITGNTAFNNLTITEDINVASQSLFEEILFDGNVITTTSSNADLELQAAGTGEIIINEQIDISNNLQFADLSETGLIAVNNLVSFDTANISDITIQGNRITHNSGNDVNLISTGQVKVNSTNVIVNNDTTINGTTNILNTTINGNVQHTGNYQVTGNFDIGGEFTNGNILIEDNFITTTESNSDLELRANGTGVILIDSLDTVTIQNNLAVGGVLTYAGFLTINGDVNLAGNLQDGNLTVTEDLNLSSNLDVSKQAQFEEILIDDNFITTTSSNTDLELRANGTGNIKILNNTVLPNTLSTGTFSTVDINSSSNVSADEFYTTSGNIKISENFIETTVSNSNLELRATGDVVVPNNNITLEQNLTVNGDVDLDNTIITGTITHTGNTVHTGNFIQTGDFTVSGNFTIADQPFQFEDILIDGNVITTTLSNSNFDLRANGTGVVSLEGTPIIKNTLTVRNANVENININNSFALENMVSSTDIEIFDNVITTTNSNSNLELRAAGTGGVYLQDLSFEQNILSTSNSAVILDAPTVTINADGALTLPVGTTAQRIARLADQIVDGGDADDVLTTVYDGGDANTVFGPSDLILDAGVAETPDGNAGDIRFNTTLGLFEGFSTAEQFFGGVYSQNTLTNVRTSNSNTIELNVNGSLVGTVRSTDLEITGLDIDDVQIRNNTISITGANNLTLTTPGTGLPILNNFKFDSNLFSNESATGLTIRHTSNGYAKIDTNTAVVTPVGTDANRGATPQVGEVRWNTEQNIQEVYDGTNWIATRGVVNDLTASEFEEIIDFWTLVLG